MLGMTVSLARRLELQDMKRRMLALGLLAGGMTAATLAGGIGIAHADPDPFTPPAPGLIDQILTETPDLFVDPRDEGGPSANSDRVGMYCENMFVRCH
jgi:hypothetical protein